MASKWVNRISRVWMWVLLIVGVSVVAAHADGFRNPPEGGSVLGRAGVRLTQGENAAATVHNPANLMDLTDVQGMASVTFAFSEPEYTSPLGLSQKATTSPAVLPSFFMSKPLKDGRYTLGVALHVPYGQATEWDEAGLFQFVAPHFARMRTANFSPALATRLGERISVGVGADLMWSDLEFKQRFPLLPPPAGLTGPATTLGFRGDGVAFGAHLGLTVEVAEGHRMAVTYRTPMSVDYEGDFSMNPAPAGAFPPPITAASDFETTVDFPSVVAFGYGVEVTERVRVEANVEWVEHSRNASLDLDIGPNNALLLMAQGSTSLPQNWDDTWTFGLGSDIVLNEDWVGHMGWTYLPTPVPEATLMPSLPEGDKHVVGFGLTRMTEKGRLEMAYGLNIAEDRTVDDPRNPIPGTYDFNQHLLTVAYGGTF